MTKEEKCPTCGGPAIDRSEYWVSCWIPEQAIQNRRANRIAEERDELRRQLAEKDKVIAEFDFDVVPRLMDEIQARQDRIGSLEAFIHYGLTVTASTDDSDMRDWRNQAKDAIATLPQAVEIPAPKVTARVEGNKAEAYPVPRKLLAMEKSAE